MTAGGVKVGGDTIVAIATPPGTGAVGLVRLSGPEAVALAGRFVRLVSGASLAEAAPRLLHSAALLEEPAGSWIDSILVVRMPAPRSYTGEDVVELSCHGNPSVLAGVVARLARAGARLAEPGEFTRRAYLNGRMDLLQAEAVADLIAARGERAARLAALQLRGGMSARIEALRAALIDVIAGREVRLDFPEDETASGPDWRDATSKVVTQLRVLIEGAVAGRVSHDGLTISLVGAPNVGKSSLLNTLLEYDRAIVDPRAGTTRDIVDAMAEIGGTSVRLIDGAGLGAPADRIEAEGMRRSRAAMADADLVMIVLDSSRALAEAECALLRETETRERIVIANKKDLPRSPALLAEPAVVSCSALTGDGVPEVRKALERWVLRRTALDADEGGIVASLRAIELLRGCETAMARALAANSAPVEAVLVDLRDALEALDRAVGRTAEEAVLDRIFAAFCVGK